MKFSKFGTKFTHKSPIMQLMDDLGEALQSDKPINMLGTGNPARIPEVDAQFLETFVELTNSQNANNQNAVVDSLGNYSSPQGHADFIHALVDFMNRNYSESWGRKITSKNVVLTNGSQNAFFFLFNIFSGAYADGSTKKILLPLAPEYVGYADVNVDVPEQPHFVSVQADIEEAQHTDLDGNVHGGFFKYKIDFEKLENNPELLAGNIGAICCSRPTNPTGNVLTDAEMDRLSEIAQKHNIPLIIDNAYGMPFPSIIYNNAQLKWDENTILCCSLSKVGLAGLRTGIIIASEDVVQTVSALNAVVNLAPSSVGPGVAKAMLEGDKLKKLSENHIRPFYQNKANTAIKLLQQELAGYPLKIHKPEGAIFLWLWFDGLPVSSMELYKRLKEAGTLIIPSEHFFIGTDVTDYKHAHECIRMSVAQSDEVLKAGIATIGKVVRELYDNAE